MLLRTHMALAVLAVILFIGHVNNQLLFAFVVLVATMLPDIDSAFSTLGKNKSFRFLQFFVRHRGIIHSFTFCIAASLLLAVFVPKITLAFFLGYSLHLFIDSFTKDGILPFWPSKKRSSWRLKTGSIAEATIFLILILIDVFLILFWFF